jgi:hypothetical protein
MATLTQLDLSYIEENGSSTDSEEITVAYHRLHHTCVNFLPGRFQFDFYVCKSVFDLKWKKLGSWKVDNKESKSIIAVKALESYDLFAFVGNNLSGTEIVLVSFDGTIRCRQTISSRKDIICVDYNQKTREFFLGFGNGLLMCCFVNCSNHYDYTITTKRVIKVHSPQKFQYAKQIITQDFLSLMYILTSLGNILCIDLTKFDLIFSISRSNFVLNPVRLYCDKFGTDFLVQSANDEHTQEQLEYWHPPEDYATCRLGRFERFSLPLSSPERDGQIIGCNFESLGLYSGKCLLTLILNNRKLQLWNCLGGTSLNFEAEMSLNIPTNTWKKFYNVFNTDNILEKDNFFPQLDQHLMTGSFLSFHDIESLISKESVSKYSSILLTSFCNLSLIIGIQLTQKKDQDLSMAYIEMEVNNNQGSSSLAAKLEDLQRQLTITRQVSNDDNESQMSETLLGALSDLAQKNRSIDEKMIHSQSAIETYNDSIISYASSAAEPVPALLQMPVTTTTSASFFVNPSNPQPEVIPPRGPLLSLGGRLLSEPLLDEELLLHHRHQHPALAPRSSNLAQLLSRSSHYLSNDDDDDIFTELSSMNFFPSFLLNNSDISKCTTNLNSQLLRIMNPYGMILNENYDLLTFTLDGGLVFLNSDSNEKRLTIDYHSFAYRCGLMTVISNFKDCLICDFSSINSLKIPMKISLTISNHIKVTCLVSADLFLKGPAPPQPASSSSSLSTREKKLSKSNSSAAVTKNNSSSSSSSSGSNNVGNYVVLFNNMNVVAVGDSQGCIHLTICDSSSQNILQSESFQAHATAVKEIIFTADAMRPLLNLGAEYLPPANNKLIASAIPGSSLITVSIEGEVKVWQPFSVDTSSSASSKAAVVASLDKFYHNCHIRWKLSGIFHIDRTYSVRDRRPLSPLKSNNASKPSTAGLIQPPTKKMREIVSVVLAPGCLNLLIGYTNGTVEEWSIPGLLDTQEASLSTAQKEIWMNDRMHSEEITSMRVYIHGPYSAIKQVSLSPEHERDAILIKLSTFIRVPNRMKYTAGFTFQEIKTISLSSSLITCSKDQTLVLWSFQTGFRGHCSYLLPLPIRKFYFSSIPTNGLCYCLNYQSGASITSTSLGNYQWRIDVILNSKVQSIISSTRDSLFATTGTKTSDGLQHEMLYDYRTDPRVTNENIVFDDDNESRVDSPPTSPKVKVHKKTALGEKSTKIVFGMPVITPILKASYLVNGYQTYNSTFDAPASSFQPFSRQQEENRFNPPPSANNSDLISTNLLKEWTKIEAKFDKDSYLSTAQLSDRPRSSVSSPIKELDFGSIPEYIDESNKNFHDYISDLAENRSNLRSSQQPSRNRSPSPLLVTIPSSARASKSSTMVSEDEMNASNDQAKKQAVAGIFVKVGEPGELLELEKVRISLVL